MSRMLHSALAIGAAFALSACETVGDIVGEGLQATLMGPGGASGNAEITLVDRTDNLCYEISVRNVPAPTSASLRRGGPAGTSVTDFDVPADGESNGCEIVPSGVIDEMERAPGTFFVVVGTAANPVAASGSLRR